VPVIAQEKDTGDVLMFAWMNCEALQKTAELKRAVYFSRTHSMANEIHPLFKVRRTMPIQAFEG
jgi:hypothetical protein